MQLLWSSIKINQLGRLSFSVRDDAHSSSFHRRLAEEVKFVELFASYLKEFDSLLFSNPWLPVKCDVERLFFFCFFSPYDNIDKSIWRTYLAYCSCCFEDEVHALSSYDHLQCFSPRRIGVLNSCRFKVKFLLSLMNLCLTEPYTDPRHWMCTTFANALLCLLKCILCYQWFGSVFFYCCCISGVYLWSALSGSSIYGLFFYFEWAGDKTIWG